MNIAIDGPAGAGKSTIAKLAASALGSVYVDTGAMYRTLALFVLEKGIDPSDEKGVLDVIGGADITLSYVDGVQHISLNGRDVTGEIRTAEVTRTSSMIAAYAGVRSYLVAMQQKIAARMPVVMDGRDICSVVLPDAEVKIYLTASARKRAERRLLQNEEMQKANGGPALTPEEREAELGRIEQEIRDRDYRDMHREASPLVQAPDAVVVDSSDMTIDEVVSAILEIAEKAAK